MRNHPILHVHVSLQRPGLLERGLTGLRNGLRSLGEGAAAMLDGYTPEGAQRMADQMDDRSFRSFVGTHAAFWSTVPLAAGLLLDLPLLAAVGVAGLVGGVGYAIYNAVR
ncbi:MAG: hypothetical protein AB1758_04605 [Candidatus Eremiobacterota bacterium]